MSNDKVIGFLIGGVCATCVNGYLMYKEGRRHGDSMYALGLETGIKLERLIQKLKTEEKEEE